MMDAANVISHALDGHVKDFARLREITLSRAYEMLGDQCVYPKAKLLIRDIAAVNPEGYALIKADLMALFAELDGLETSEVSIAEMSQELHDPLQARLDKKPKAVRLQECREGIKVLAREISAIEREDRPLVRVEMAKAVEGKRNGTR